MPRRPRYHILTTDHPREKHAEYTYCDKVAIAIDPEGAHIKKVEFITPNQVVEVQKMGQVRLCKRCLGELHWDSD